jgi:hypothetical protein
MAHIFNQIYQGLTRDFAEFSPEIAVARAEQEIELTLRNLELANRIGTQGAEVTTAETRLLLEVQELKASVSELFYPVVVSLLGTAEKILRAVNAVVDWGISLSNWSIKQESRILEFMGWFPTPLAGVARLISWMQKDRAEKEKDQKKNPYMQEVIEFMSGRGDAVGDFYRDSAFGKARMDAGGTTIIDRPRGAAHRAGVRQGRR